jgi:hypothetical protein
MKNTKNQTGIDIIRLVITSPNIVILYISKRKGGNFKLPPRAKVWMKNYQDN